MKSLLFDLFILKAYFIQEYVENMNFQDMSEGCQEAVQALAKCNGRERVDHIVAIHINAFTGSLHIPHCCLPHCSYLCIDRYNTVINHHVISCPHFDHIIAYQCIHRYCSCFHKSFYLFLSWLHLNQCPYGTNDQNQLFDSVTFHNIDQMSTKSCSLGPFVCPDVQTPIEEPNDIFDQFKLDPSVFLCCHSQSRAS